MNPWLTVALVLLATWRLTRLLVADAFPPVAKPRQWVVGRFGDGSSVAYLVECPWCMSVWVGAAVVAGQVLWGRGGCPLPVWTWLAASGFSGLVSRLTDVAEEAATE